MNAPLPRHIVNSASGVAVATDYFWLEVDNRTPIGVKLQLLGKGGVAIYGAYSPKSDFFTHWAPLPKRMPLDPDVLARLPAGSTYRASADGSAAVAIDYFWIPVGPKTPIGAKLQLLGRGGVAVYGTYSPRNDFFAYWAPLPKRRPNLGMFALGLPG